MLDSEDFGVACLRQSSGEATKACTRVSRLAIACTACRRRSKCTFRDQRASSDRKSPKMPFAIARRRCNRRTSASCRCCCFGLCSGDAGCCCWPDRAAARGKSAFVCSSVALPTAPGNDSAVGEAKAGKSKAGSDWPETDVVFAFFGLMLCGDGFVFGVRVGEATDESEISCDGLSCCVFAMVRGGSWRRSSERRQNNTFSLCMHEIMRGTDKELSC